MRREEPRARDRRERCLRVPRSDARASLLFAALLGCYSVPCLTARLRLDRPPLLCHNPAWLLSARDSPLCRRPVRRQPPPMTTMENEVAELHLSVQERIQLAIQRLPVLTKDEIPQDDSCPICINTFEAIMDGKAREGLGEESPKDDELAGVTKLVGCGHIFCKAWYAQRQIILCSMGVLIALVLTAWSNGYAEE